MKKKTISLSEEDIQKVVDYQKRMGLKNFTEAIRSMIQISVHSAPKNAGD